MSFLFFSPFPVRPVAGSFFFFLVGGGVHHRLSCLSQLPQPSSKFIVRRVNIIAKFLSSQ